MKNSISEIFRIFIWFSKSSFWESIFSKLCSRILSKFPNKSGRSRSIFQTKARFERYLVFFGLLSSPIFSASVTLVNDSAFALTAEIFNAANDHLATVKLSPNQTYMWNDNQSPFRKQYDSTTTPFTITFSCANARPYDYSPPPKKGSKVKKPAYQSQFGSWTGVPTGATVNALGVNGGTKSCVIKKGAKQGAPAVKKPGPKNSKSEGFNNWSNDGGQTWTNDSGSGWEDSDFSEDF